MSVTPTLPSTPVRSASVAKTGSPGRAGTVAFWRTMKADPEAILTCPAGEGCWASTGVAVAIMNVRTPPAHRRPNIESSRDKETFLHKPAQATDLVVARTKVTLPPGPSVEISPKSSCHPWSVHGSYRTVI